MFQISLFIWEELFTKKEGDSVQIKNASAIDSKIKIINAGQVYITDSDEIIGTLLGACVSVLLIDKKRKISGLNHFVYPGKINSYDRSSNKQLKYGVNAVNHLIEAMIEKGSDRNDLEAAVFGGGIVMDFESDYKEVSKLKYDNVSVAKMLLELEDIEIVSEDVGGNFIRKVLYDNSMGKIYLKKKRPSERGLL